MKECKYIFFKYCKQTTILTKKTNKRMRNRPKETKKKKKRKAKESSRQKVRKKLIQRKNFFFPNVFLHLKDLFLKVLEKTTENSM